MSIVKTGGIAGVHKEVVVKSDGSDTAGLPADARRQLFDLVASPEFTQLNYTPASRPCCDIFQYEITVQYTSQEPKSFIMYDRASDPPAILSRVVRIATGGS